MQFLESQEYSMFTRIVFDTAPTVSKKLTVLYFRSPFCFLALHCRIYHVPDQGHTLRLLSLPDFLDASIGKILKVRLLNLILWNSSRIDLSCSLVLEANIYSNELHNPMQCLRTCSNFEIKWLCSLGIIIWCKLHCHSTSLE